MAFPRLQNKAQSCHYLYEQNQNLHIQGEQGVTSCQVVQQTNPPTVGYEAPGDSGSGAHTIIQVVLLPWASGFLFLLLALRNAEELSGTAYPGGTRVAFRIRVCVCVCVGVVWGCSSDSSFLETSARIHALNGNAGAQLPQTEPFFSGKLLAVR